MGGWEGVRAGADNNALWCPHPESNRDCADFKSADSTSWPMRACSADIGAPGRSRTCNIRSLRPATLPIGPQGRTVVELGGEGGSRTPKAPSPTLTRFSRPVPSPHRIASPSSCLAEEKGFEPLRPAQPDSRASNAVPLPCSLSDYSSAHAPGDGARGRQLEYRSELGDRRDSRLWRSVKVMAAHMGAAVTNSRLRGRRLALALLAVRQRLAFAPQRSAHRTNILHEVIGRVD